MAPVDDALDRLGYFLANGDPRANPMVDIVTVRSALEQLREERDSQDWYSEWYAPMKRRAEAAEAELQRLRGGISVRDALVTVNRLRAAAAEAEVQRLREERDGWEKIAEGRADYIEGWQLDAKVDELRAAEAEAQRYREGLRELLGPNPNYDPDGQHDYGWENEPPKPFAPRWVRDKVDALLADRPDGGGAK